MGQWCSCCEVKSGKPIAHITPNSERGCTDVLFLILFALSWVIIVIIFSQAVELGGNPDRIVKPVDYLGRICGKHPDVADKKWGAFPNPLYYPIKICVADCAETSTSTSMTINYRSIGFVYFCIPAVNASIQVNITVGFDGSFENVSEQASRTIGDLLTAWPVLLVSAFAALALSFFYAWLCKRYATLMVWTAIIFIIAGGFIFAYTLIKEADNYASTEVSDRAKAMRGVGYTFVIATVLFILAVFFLRERIRIAIAIVKEAAEAVSDMKMIIFFPVIPFFCAMGYFVWWISVSLYIMSVGEYVDKPVPDIVRYRPSDLILKNNPIFPVNFTDFQWNQQLKNSFAANFFHMLWNIQFMVYFTFMVCAGAIAEWYFTPRDNEGNKPRGDGDNLLSNTPVTDSFWRTIRFHLGTLALGSFIIAVIQFIRACVKYFEEQMQRTQGEPSRLQKCFFCCIQCCLKCVECCMDKINKNAFVWTAIWGDNFGTAACSSFALIWKNLLRVAALTVVSEYLVILGKVVVALMTAGLAALFMANSGFDEVLSSIVMPSVVVFIIAFLVAALFMAVFETCIDTTFICFLVDEEHNKGGNMLASRGLLQVVDDHQEANQRYFDRHTTVRAKRLGVTKEQLTQGQLSPPPAQ